MFSAPTFELSAVVYTCVGVIILWSRLGYDGRRAYGLSDVIELFGFSTPIRPIVEFFLFVSLGSVLAVVIVQPTNAPQAIAAGLGWTGLVSTKARNRPATSRPNR